ncbi:hypothetical protein [Planctomicrobium sp. SH527]|uniref:hypothetical protein n=1 Tax=Planctomicrobium sp. SH527 TaxID=3448123 RepID=UPI003F5C2F54
MNTDATPLRSETSIQRRKALALLGLGGLTVASSSTAIAQQTQAKEASNNVEIRTFPNVAAMRDDSQLQDGWITCTLGYFNAGDGGSANYQIAAPEMGSTANDADVIALTNGKQARMLPDNVVNYHMFGAKGDGKSDDGVQIKLAHLFANKHRLPVIHHSGEYWITKTHEILISTNVEWGSTLFHINEKFSLPTKPRFIVRGLSPNQNIKLTDAQKASFLEKLKPGVAVLPEMAPYANCLVTVADANDRIGYRSGDDYKGQSWAREELFYVEEDGRILGDIAWSFKDYTTLTAQPCENTYLTIDGGGFYVSGDIPGDKHKNYFSCGFSIQRSRTIIRNQWQGLEPGNRDISMQARSGFYYLSRVFDVTLENIRLIPWEQNRADPARKVTSGTYGIGGARMLNCTFRNLTADGTWLHWGVFGTNLNKNFRIENCRLNRVDVHFHCWNLTIQDSTIGMRGISVTGGGNLTIENTTSHANTLVNLRSDFGGTWNGDIRIQNCRIVPSHDRPVSVLYSRPAQFNYGYPIGCARTLSVENLVVDFSYFPKSVSEIWLMQIAQFSTTKEDAIVFFPHAISFRNVTVTGRDKGMRIVSIPSPYHYQMPRSGGYDGNLLQTNCQMEFANLDLEEIPASVPGAALQAHLNLGSKGSMAYPEGRGLYPNIQVTNCPNLCLSLGGSAANVVVSNGTIDRLTAAIEGPLRGKLVVNDCQFLPRVKAGTKPIYALDAELGTHLTNCTLHAPQVNGTSAPAAFDQTDFVQLNKRVRYFQLNTSLSNQMLKHIKDQSITLNPAFISMLKSHHGLETENVS